MKDRSVGHTIADPLTSSPSGTGQLGDGTKILTSRAAFYLADSVIPVALVFTVVRNGGSILQLGAVLAVQSLIGCAATIPAGLIADRKSRRGLILSTDASLTGLYLFVGVALLSHSLSLVALVLAMSVRAVLVAGGRPALTGLIAERIQPDLRNKANGKLSMLDSVAWLIGPGLAGLFLIRFNSGWVFLWCAACCALAFVMMWALPGRARRAASINPVESPTILQDVRAAWSAIRERPWYLASLVSHSVGGFAMTSVIVLGPVVYSRSADGSASWGFIMVCGSLGALAGGFAVFRRIPRRPLRIANGLVGLACLEAFSLALGSPVLVVCAAFALGTMAMVYLNEVWATVVQREMPLRLMSSTSSFDWMISLAAAPLGYFVAGASASRFGVETTLMVAGCLVLCSSLAGALIPSVRQYQLPLDVSPIATVQPAGAMASDETG